MEYGDPNVDFTFKILHPCYTIENRCEFPLRIAFDKTKDLEGEIKKFLKIWETLRVKDSPLYNIAKTFIETIVKEMDK